MRWTGKKYIRKAHCWYKLARDGTGVARYVRSVPGQQSGGCCSG